MTEIKFSEEIVKLIDNLLQASEGDEILEKQVKDYQKGYHRTATKQEKHKETFAKLWEKHFGSIMNDDTANKWLATSDFIVTFGSGQSNARLPISAIYNLAVLRASKPNPNKPLTPLYPQIIALHLMRIFSTVVPEAEKNAVKIKVTLLQSQLRPQQATPPGMDIKGIVGNASMFLKTLAGNDPKASETIDQLASKFTSDDFTKSISSLGQNMGSLVEQLPTLGPKVWEGLQKVGNKEMNLGEFISNTVNEPVIKSSLDKMDILKPFIVDGAKALEEKGYPTEDILPSDLEKMSISDIVGKMIAGNNEIDNFDPDSFSEMATRMVQNGINSVVGTEGSITQDQVNQFLTKFNGPQ
jgi:hypothetical protein